MLFFQQNAFLGIFLFQFLFRRMVLIIEMFWLIFRSWEAETVFNALEERGKSGHTSLWRVIMPSNWANKANWNWAMCASVFFICGLKGIWVGSGSTVCFWSLDGIAKAACNTVFPCSFGGQTQLVRFARQVFLSTVSSHWPTIFHSV